MDVRRIVPLTALSLIGTVAALAGGPAARASVTPGYQAVGNWAGYQVEAGSSGMTQVSGSWTQPRARCTRKVPYSEVSTWVGLGAPAGAGTAGTRIEQIGENAICGKAKTSIGFWENWPAPSHTVKHPIAPGDRLRASVSIIGHAVTMKLSDLTRHWTFTKRLSVAAPDERSAEWIVEDTALNGLPDQYSPLAGFSPVTFTHAHAESANGGSGTISSSPWAASRIDMVSQDRLRALPSALFAGGASFKVSYTSGPPPPEPDPGGA